MQVHLGLPDPSHFEEGTAMTGVSTVHVSGGLEKLLSSSHPEKIVLSVWAIASTVILIPQFTNKCWRDMAVESNAMRPVWQGHRHIAKNRQDLPEV